MRALIIEDERLARKELRQLLAHHPAIEVCGEAPNAAVALELCAQEKPELLFLDIEMPGKNGFTLLEELPLPHPHVIFVTAYDAYAVEAFEANALDYLLKPVNPKRLAAALARLPAPGQAAATSAATTPVEAAEGSAPALGHDDRVFVRDGDKCWFVAVKTIRLLESVGNHTELHFNDRKALVCRTVISLAERLPSSLFMRANRSQIVNLGFIEAVSPWFSGSIKVTLRGGGEVEFSRRQAQLFRERLSL
ncbi:MAG: response regulator transcription factor [Opitutaceae bacterium]|nr:response regulator transcription factor [Opitutaceae bacterium]